jgi:hypothetical protein
MAFIGVDSWYLSCTSNKKGSHRLPFTLYLLKFKSSRYWCHSRGTCSTSPF